MKILSFSLIVCFLILGLGCTKNEPVSVKDFDGNPITVEKVSKDYTIVSLKKEIEQTEPATCSKRRGSLVHTTYTYECLAHYKIKTGVFAKVATVGDSSRLVEKHEGDLKVYLGKW